MTRDEFFSKHGVEYRKLMESDLGRDLVSTLNRLKPSFQPAPTQHLLLDYYASVRGYDNCLRNLLLLTASSPERREPKANYGIDEPQDPQSKKPEQ